MTTLSPRPHQGMPPFDQDGKPLSFFEFWPMWAFYPPVMLYAAWLMLRYRGVLLPTVANPRSRVAVSTANPRPRSWLWR